jgi:hypothetical protein
MWTPAYSKPFKFSPVIHRKILRHLLQILPFSPLYDTYRFLKDYIALWYLHSYTETNIEEINKLESILLTIHNNTSLLPAIVEAEEILSAM